jgi:hypothetical protein
MALPRTPTKYSDKDRVERSIDAYAAKEKPTIGDLNTVKVIAQVEIGLDKYRAAAMNMTIDELEDERHQSKVLSDFMAATGNPRPHRLCHAHAIVSGAHKYAAELRATMAWLRLRIDDPDNGCWLPQNTAAKAHMPRHLRNAVPHSRIHRYNYYFWLNRQINPVVTDTQRKMRDALRLIETRLQAGTQPVYVMKKKGERLPA